MSNKFAGHTGEKKINELVSKVVIAIPPKAGRSNLNEFINW